MKMDVNTDTGESFGRWQLGDHARLLPYVSSANIACGMHAGDPPVMDQVVSDCLSAGVAVGAHPGFPDLQGFGRREIKMSPKEVESFVMYQVGALKVFAESHGAGLTHVKAHGSLYNMASVDDALAMAVARGVARSTRRGEHLVLVGLAGSRLLWAGQKLGLPVAAEGFCDRAYTSDGNLVPRSVPGSLVTDLAAIAERAVGMARGGAITAIDGSRLSLKVDTLCIHSDTPGAVEIAASVSSALKSAGIEVVPLHRVLGL
ncbi:MAG: LamB/YcsF family protein [Bacillota bacterium]